MVGFPIGDGFGGFLEDGFGQDLLDGYPEVSSADVFRLARTVVAHFQNQDFPGAQRTRYGAPPAGPPVSPVHATPSLQRRLTTYAQFFSPEEYKKARLPRRDFFYYPGGTNLPARASQEVVEALSRGTGTRVSQAVVETLITDKPGLRASQAVVEALYAQHNPTYVRASQFALEVLIPFLEAPVVPVYPALIGITPKIEKYPKLSTGTGVGSSGREVRIGYWATPQWEWDLTYDILADNGDYQGTTTADIKTLLGFLLSVYGGLMPFYFLDPDDNTVVGQPLGIGDGATKAFPFARTYGTDTILGNFVGTQNVGGVNEGEALVIYLDGVEQSTGFTISTATPVGNYVQFGTAPAAGVVVTADFSFWYYCRLKDDSYDFSKMMKNLWELKKITIFSLKN